MAADRTPMPEICGGSDMGVTRGSMPARPAGTTLLDNDGLMPARPVGTTVMNTGAARSGNAAERQFYVSELQQCLASDLSTIRQNIQTMLGQQQALAQQISVLGKTVIGFGSPGGVELICGICKSNKDVVELPVPGLLQAISGANTAVPMVQMLCVVTCAAFALQTDNGRQLCASGTLDLLTDKHDILRGGSGFSMLLFSVKNNLKRKKYATGVGRLSSLFIKESMVESLLYVKSNSYGTGRSAKVRVPAEKNNSTIGATNEVETDVVTPTWHKTLVCSTPAALRKTIETACNKMECQEPPRRRSKSSSRSGSRTPSCNAVTPARSPVAQSPLTRSMPELSMPSRAFRAQSLGSSHEESSVGDGPPPKRFRSATEAPSQSTPSDALETLEKWRYQTTKTVRSEWLDYLNGSRTDIRVYLHKNVMFLREFIEQNFEKGAMKGLPGISDAARLGYEYVFDEQSIDSELHIPEDVRDTIWDIKPAISADWDHARDIFDGNASGNYENVRRVLDLRDKFRSLTVTLVYKREVRRDPCTAFPDLIGHRETLFYDESVQLSLHVLALNLLVEIYKFRDAATMLAMSKSSLKTVHIFAIAMLRMLRKSLGQKLTQVEEAALGNAVHEDLKPEDDTVTTRLETPKAGGKKKVTVTTNYEETMTMSMEMYLAKMCEPISRTSRADAASVSEDQRAQSGESHGGGENGAMRAMERDNNRSWVLG